MVYLKLTPGSDYVMVEVTYIKKIINCLWEALVIQYLLNLGISTIIEAENS